MNVNGEKRIFSDDEIRRLAYLALRARGKATTEEMMDFVSLCERMRFDGMVVELFLGGHVEVTSYTKDDFAVRYSEANLFEKIKQADDGESPPAPSNEDLLKLLPRHE